MVNQMLRGVIPALVTPLAADGSVDTATLSRIVARAVDAGVDGLAPCGTTGEGWNLGVEARRQVLDTVVRQAAGAVPITCWVPAGTVDVTLDELSAVRQRGATMALIAPPASGGRQVSFFTELAARTPIPLVLYNIPGVSGYAVELETVRRLAGRSTVAGLKDSSRDFEYLQQVIWCADGADAFSVVTGADTLLVASMAAGAAGTIAASPGVLPHLSVSIRDAIREGDAERAWRAQRQLAEIVGVCRAHAFPAGWKAALQLLGFGVARVAPPRESPGPEFSSAVAEALGATTAFARELEMAR